jgi:hypothetical protein
MSTTSATSRTTSSKAAQTELFRTLVDGFSYNERADLIIFLTKENKKSQTKTGRVKREPKMDEDGNIVKRALSAGVISWNEFVKHVQSELEILYPDTKIIRKACLRLGKILKGKGEAADEGDNSFYPAENLSTETLQEEWEAWNALPDEEKYPKKEKKGKKGADSDSEEEELKAKAAPETEDEAEPAVKPKGRGRPAKKASPLDEEEEEAVQSSTESKASKKSKAKSVKAVEPEPEKKVAKKAKAKAEESEAEEPKAVKKGKKKAE